MENRKLVWQIWLGLVFSFGNIDSPGQEYFPYTLMDQDKAERFFQIDQNIFGDTARIIHSIKLLNEVSYLERSHIFELPRFSKENRKEYDSLRVLRDSISQDHYSRQGKRADYMVRISGEKFFYPRLKYYSAELIGSLWPTFYTEGYSQKYKMVILGVLDLPDSIRESLVSFKDTPDYIKAKLGDENIEKDIVEKFNNLVYDTLNPFSKERFVQLKKLSYQLIYINSSFSIDSYLKALQSKVVHFYVSKKGVDFDFCNYCPEEIRREWSLASELINRLSRFYPYRLLSADLSGNYARNHSSLQNRISTYFKDVEKLIGKIYDQQIHIQAEMIDNGKYPPAPKDFEY